MPDTIFLEKKKHVMADSLDGSEQAVGHPAHEVQQRLQSQYLRVLWLSFRSFKGRESSMQRLLTDGKCKKQCVECKVVEEEENGSTPAFIWTTFGEVLWFVGFIFL